MRILILGATGQVGSVVYKIVSEKYPEAEVIAGIRKPNTAIEKSILFEPFIDDWKKIGKVEVLINCIGIIEQTKEMDFEKAHVGLVKLILENRSKIGQPRIINLSVLGAEKKLNSQFLETKKAADDLLLAQADTYILRPSIVCTHNTVMVQKFRMIKKMSRLGFGMLPFPAGFLKTNIQPVMGADVAEVVARLCVGEEKNRIFILAGPEIISIRGLITGMDKRIKIIPFSQNVFNFFFGLGNKLFPRLLNKEQFTLLKTDNTGDNADTERILGRKMQITTSFWKEELQ